MSATPCARRITRSSSRPAPDGRFQLLDLGVGAERDFLWFNQNTGTNPAGKPFVNPAHLKWFRNKKFRQAVSCAIDRDRLVREVYGGRAQPTYGFISTENPQVEQPRHPALQLRPRPRPRPAGRDRHPGPQRRRRAGGRRREPGSRSPSIPISAIPSAKRRPP